MSATNSTPNLELPVFVGTDKPAWLTDWNGAMNKIDAAVGSTETDISGLESAVATQGQSITSLSNTVGQHTTSIQALTTATTHNAGDINTINSLIGNGTPTTTDQTIIGAINELHAEIGGGSAIQAGSVEYVNTASGLSATDVQAAIDEVAAAIPSVASEIKSGTLTAGQTSIVLTFTTQVIGNDTLLDIYTDTYGVNPTAIATTSSTVTLTFAAQASNLKVTVKASN